MWKWLLVLLLLPLTAEAQELDTARQYWFKVRDFLGEVNFNQYDTTDDIRSAVNAGRRAVANEIGVIGFDTVTIVADQYIYTLNTNFKPKGLPSIPYRAKYISPDGKTIRGLKITSSEEFNTTDAGTAGDAAVTDVVGCDISGNRLWIYPSAQAGGKIYLEGPIDVCTFGHGGVYEDDSANVIPHSDRMAVVHYAVHVMAASRKEPEMVELARIHKVLYDAYVLSRAGDYRLIQPK